MNDGEIRANACTLLHVFFSFAHDKQFTAVSNRLLVERLAVPVENYTASTADGPFDVRWTYARLLNRSTVGR